MLPVRMLQMSTITAIANFRKGREIFLKKVDTVKSKLLICSAWQEFWMIRPAGDLRPWIAQ